MSDLRVRFGLILALALFPILVFSIYMAFMHGRLIILAVSVLAWVFGYFAIWLATDKMVFSHLRRIKFMSDQFSTGDLSARVGSMDEAPSRIVALGHAFDNMAENVSEREARLLDNLHEKEVLLREIHHRVKNNLQIIISLLNMQERKLKDEVCVDAIKETRSRINAIALVHRGLYEGNDLRVIDMQDFLSRLVKELQRGLGARTQGIQVDMDVAPLRFEPDTAIPVALFIVEGLTNAIRHGVPNGGKVDIRLIEKDNSVCVYVADNGAGSQGPIVKGTGSKLMKGFARQLFGEIRLDNSVDGYRASLTFPHKKLNAI